MLRTLPEQFKSKWKDHLSKLRRFRHQEPDRQEEADSTDEENNVPSFTPNVLPHVLEELENNYTEEHDDSEEPRTNTDNDIVPENVSQSIPSADASEDGYQSNATSDEIPSQPLAEDSGEQVSLENATDNSIDEDAHSILEPLSDSTPPQVTEEQRPMRQRHPPSRLTYADFGNPRTEQHCFVDQAWVRPQNAVFGTQSSTTGPASVQYQYVPVPQPRYSNMYPVQRFDRQFVQPMPCFIPYFRPSFLGKVDTDHQLIDLVNSDDGLDILEAIGYRGNPQKITLLKKSDLLHAFCPTEDFKWTYAEFSELLTSEFNEEGSNKKKIEVGMEKHIHDLKYPLGQLHKEIQAIKGKLNKELEIIENKLAHRRKAKEKKTHLQHLLNATTYVEKIEKILFSDHHSKDMAIFLDNKESVGQFLERVAGDFNQLQFHVNQSKGHPIVSLIRPRVSLITSKLQESLETSFQQGLASFQSDLVLRCLRTYALIDKTDHAEDLFRHNFVREKLKTLITQDCYESNGLESVCNSVIGFIKADCDLILTLTSKAANASHQKECGIKGFNFLANAIWPEIDFAFENRLSFIFSPGNPSLFFQRFKIMMKLLNHLKSFVALQKILKN
eukprot:gene20670-22708_t